MYVTLNARHIECTSHWMYVIFNVRIKCMSYWMNVTFNVHHMEYTSHRIQEWYVESRRYHDGREEGLSRRSLTAHVWHLKYEWPSQENSLSQHILLLLAYRPPILVRVAQEGGAYAGNFCVNGRIYWPVLPLLDCRPPLLVRVELDGGRMLSTSARMTRTGACTLLLIANTGFQTKGTGMATAGYLCMMSSHKWNLQSSLSPPVLPLVGCRPPMLVCVALERRDVCGCLLALAGPFPNPIAGALG